MAAWASQGFIYAIRGLPFVATRTVDPITGGHELYVPAIDSRLTSALNFRAFLESVSRHFWGVTQVLIRREDHRPLPAPGAPYLWYFSLEQQLVWPSARPAGESWQVRSVDADSVEFVRSCIASAVVDGYATRGTPVEFLDAYAWAFRAFGSLAADEPARALVLYRRSEPAGHVTWLVPAADDVHDEPAAEIIDVYVRPAFRNGGATSRLLSTVASMCQSRLLGSVVVDADAPDVCHRLVAHGWRPAHAINVAMTNRADDA